MAVLHIEHPVTDFAAWQQTFASFAARREQGGVTAERIARPVDDDQYVVIDLEFGRAEQAQAFLGFLTSQVWPRAQVLAGAPQARVLEIV
jgi:hypothetical protein